jgi:general secretion pathway protein M
MMINQAVQQQWRALAPRQRALSLIALVVLGLAAWWLWLWEPMQASQDRHQMRVAQQQAELDWLQALAPEVAALRERTPEVSDLGDRSLLGVADQTARAAGLAGALTRIEPAGDNQVRVWLDGADYGMALGWLQRLSAEYPIDIAQLGVERGARSGQVTLRVTLARSG